jgi:hypothetical protein
MRPTRRPVLRRLPPHGRRRAYALGVESLEDRRLPSAMVALTAQNQLLRFDSESPTVIQGSAAIAGLQGGESVLGIDVRPATGELYALGSSGRLYVVDPVSGAATERATLTADPTDATDPFTGLSGTDFGIDFNPVPDRLRVVSDANQNLRINPINGRVITDTPLSYTAGTPHAGEDPTIVDAAYSNNVAGATTTTLYGIDSKIHIIVTQGSPGGTPTSPNTGLLTKVVPFGKEGSIPVGFDISPSGTAFIAVNAPFPNGQRTILVTNDLVTEGDSNRGTIADGLTAVRDIAVLPSVQFSAPLFAIGEDGGSATITVTRTEGSVGTVTVNFAAVGGTATAGADFTSTTGTLTFGPGETTKTFTVPVANDTDGEGDEFVTLVLGNPTGAAVLGSPAAAQLRINASDLRDRTGPIATRALERGPSRGITGAVLAFNEDLDPARAQNVGNYSIFGIGARGRRTQIALSSATYDPVRREVTLTATQPFMQTQFRQLLIRASGRRRTGIADLAGNLLDGNNDRRPGGDAMFRFQVISGPTVTITDRDGDRGTITIANGGSLDAIMPMRGPRTQDSQFWVLDPIALQSVVSGTVTRGTRGDGLIVIAEIIGLDKKEFTPLFNNPAFRVNRSTFSTNATGTF